MRVLVLLALMFSGPAFAGVIATPSAFECRGPVGVVLSGSSEPTVTAACQTSQDSDRTGVYQLAKLHTMTATPIVLPPPPPVGLSRVIAFGDSMSDDAVLVGRTVTATRQLSGLLQVPYREFAVNGATAAGMLSQINQHIARGERDQLAAYYLWNNGNEFFGCPQNVALADFLACARVVSAQSAANIAAAVRALRNVGITDLTVMGPRDLGLTPISVGMAAFATQVSVIYRDEVVRQLPAGTKFVDMIPFTATLMQQLGSGTWVDSMHFSTEANRRIALMLQGRR